MEIAPPSACPICRGDVKGEVLDQALQQHVGPINLAVEFLRFQKENTVVVVVVLVVIVVSS